MTKNQKILAAVLIGLGVLIIIFFGMRTIRSFKRMHGEGPFGKPPAADQTDVGFIRDWMTVPYIAHTYHVPPEAIFRALNIPGHGNEKESLLALNNAYYPNDDGAVLAHVQAVIQAFQKHQPPPPFPATPVFTPTP